MLPLKYVIIDNQIFMSRVQYHKDLVKVYGKEDSVISGGGYWAFDKEKEEIYFYSSSQEYGYVDKLIFFESMQNSEFTLKKFKGYKLYFSHFSLLSTMLGMINKEDFIII